MVEYKILKAGYCLQNELCSIIKGKNKQTKFYAMFVLIKHEKYGNILFDTGYSNYLYEASKNFPYSIYAKITPVFIDKENSAKAQLEKLGIKPDEISYTIISHFHADHIAGLKDFNKTKFICLEEAYQNIKNKKGFSALKEGFLPDLLPDNFNKRLVFLENKIENSEFRPFNYYYDIFGDKSILAFDLSGHAKGQVGILVCNKFFISDACWYSNSYKKNLPPPLWVRLLLGDNKKYLKTLDKLHKFYNNHPKIEIIPSHCNDFWSKYV